MWAERIIRGVLLTLAFVPGAATACGGFTPGLVDAAASAPAGTAEVKFRLAARACGSRPALVRPAAPGAASQDAGHETGREAAQLALYARGPVSMAAPSAAPTAAAGPVIAPAVPLARREPRERRVGARVPSNSAVQRIRALVPTVAAAAQRWDVDPLLLHAVAHVESRHNPQALSHAGARGVMQVMPATARRFGVGDPLRELHQPAVSIDVGAEYLKTLQKRFGNNLPLVLAAYNAGEGAVEKHGRRIPPYRETQNYVRQVMHAYEHLRRAAAHAPMGVAP